MPVQQPDPLASVVAAFADRSRQPEELGLLKSSGATVSLMSGIAEFASA
jgi:hypothetical protein